MSDLDQNPQQGPNPDEGGKEEHISFVQKLTQQYGQGVDPRITLQEKPEEGEGTAPKEESRSGQSSTSKGLLEKLSQESSSGYRYRIHRELARGGMGTILQVWDDDLRRNLAMKVMHGMAQSDGTEPVDEERLGRFLEEAQITGQLDHPGVVPVHNMGLDSAGRCYFTMRLVRGRELKEVLDLTREEREGWTTSKTLGLILKVCEAMAFAHSKGVVHRDLKPANIMVGRFGEVYVMDWGLARVLGRRDSHERRIKPADDPSAMSLVRTVRKDESISNPDSPLVTMDGDVVGTPSYMAPEQAQGRLGDVGPRSDVYSLGAVLYYMLTGRAPYVEPGERVSPHTVLTRALEGPPAPLSKYAKDVPGELVAICEKAMARDPEHRYASMLDVAEDIQAYIDNRVVRAYEGGAVAEFRKWVGRNRGMAAATAGLVLLSIVSAIGFGVQKSKQFDLLALEKEETARANEESKRNLSLAVASEAEAARNLELALERQEEASANALIAQTNAQLARRSSYMANLIAANYSVRLHDVVEARRRLEESDPDLRGWEWKHLNLRTYPEISTFNIGEAIDEIAVSPDGTRLMTITRSGRLRVLDSSSGEVLPPKEIFNVSLTWQSTRKRSLSLDAQGERVALAGLDSVVRIFDLRTSEESMSLPRDLEDTVGHQTRISTIAFDPTCKRLVSGDENGKIFVWDLASGTIEQGFEGHVGQVNEIKWSPNGRWIASGGSDSTARVWDVGSGQELAKFMGHEAAVTDVAWDSSGEVLASSSRDQTIHVWDFETRSLRRSLSGHQQEVRSIEFHPRSPLLASAGDDMTIRLWDIDSGDARVIVGHEEAVGSVHFDPSGDRLYSFGSDLLLKTWDAVSDSATTTLTHHEKMVTAAAFRPGADEILSASEDGTMAIWNRLTGQLLNVIRVPGGTLYDAAYSPDGKTILTGSVDKKARLWDADTGRLLREFKGHDKWVSAVAFAPDGSWILTGSGDGVFRAWDPATGELLHTREGNPKWLRALVVSPDGKRVAAGGVSHEIMVWDLWEETPTLVLPGHERRGIHSLAFAPDGRTLVSAGSTDHTARVWDLSSGDCVRVLRGHEQTVTALAFDSKGSRLVTGSMDRTIRVWDLISEGSLLVLRGHDSEVTSLAFSEDGSQVLSGSRDATVKVWESGQAASRRRLQRLARDLDRQAQPRVDRLFAQYFFLDEVLLRVQADPDLSQELREACLRVARIRGDDPARLDAYNRELILEPGKAPELYAGAVRRALAACSLDRDDARLLSSLGMAQYRAGQCPEAVESLTKARNQDLRRRGNSERAFDPREKLLVDAFLAMSHAKAGDPVQARAFLETAVAQRDEVSHPIARSVLAEAQSLIGAVETEG